MSDYTAELVADILDHGGPNPGESLEDALTAAHKRRQAFANEMLQGATERAQIAKKLLMVSVYNNVRISSAIEQADKRTNEAFKGVQK